MGYRTCGQTHKENITQYPQSVKGYHTSERWNRRIIHIGNEQIIWQCGYCSNSYSNEKDLHHIGKTHSETKLRQLVCTYCHATSRNVANLKVRLLYKNAVKPGHIPNLRWGDVVNANRRDEIPGGNRNNMLTRGNFGKLETSLKRLTSIVNETKSGNMEIQSSQ